MGKKIHLGLVGFGPNGWGHINALKFHPKLKGRTEIVKIFDPNPETQLKIKKQGYEIAENFESLLNTPGLDALMISSPPQFHADQAVMGLEAGLHVFSEVPMAIKAPDIERIIQAEDKANKAYQFGENYIFYSEVLYASHLVETGKIGASVYAESEYLHDVSYRWIQKSTNVTEGTTIPQQRKSWYSLFDPLAYAHSIGPAQVALGGLNSPMPFIEVSSYANDLGGENGTPICTPSKAFHVALFQTPTGATAKCANAYVVALEPMRMGVRLIGELGTYEAFEYGKPSRLFLADDHKVNQFNHRKGTSHRIGRWAIRKIAPQGIHHAITAIARVTDDWLTAIEKDSKPHLHAKIAGNMTMAGIAASESARTHKIVTIPRYDQ